jgi:hypothetical protein
MGQNTNFPTFPTIKRKPDNNYFYGYILTNIFLFIALCCHTKIICNEGIQNGSKLKSHYLIEIFLEIMLKYLIIFFPWLLIKKIS